MNINLINNIDFFIFIICVFLLVAIGKFFITPIKWIIKLILNSILGGFLIYIVNLIIGLFGIHIGLNLYTSLFVRDIRNTRDNISNFTMGTLIMVKKLPKGQTLYYNFYIISKYYFLLYKKCDLYGHRKIKEYVIYISLLKFPLV